MSRSGLLDQSMYAAKVSMERLLPYENVKLYYFQTEEDIVMNLDLFMDPVHFTADINHWMVEQMKDDNYRLTVDNYQKELDLMWKISEYIKENYDVITETVQ